MSIVLKQIYIFSRNLLAREQTNNWLYSKCICLRKQQMQIFKHFGAQLANNWRFTIDFWCIFLSFTCKSSKFVFRTSKILIFAICLLIVRLKQALELRNNTKQQQTTKLTKKLTTTTSKLLAANLRQATRQRLKPSIEITHKHANQNENYYDATTKTKRQLWRQN